jgi:nucleoside-diphosphate-sugar epimerase
MQRRADCSKARRELGFHPTRIEDAVQEAYDWFVEHGAIRSPVARGRAEQVEVRS